MPRTRLNSVLSLLRQVGEHALRRYPPPSRRDEGRERLREPRARLKPRQPRRTTPTPELSSRYPGDYTTRPEIVYDPHRDGRPDPGEIVWTWVPYEEDYTQGKDRPVLLIGRDGPWLLGLQVTSQDNDRDAHEARAGRYWMDIGAGEWDRRRRPSEVRVNRIVRINPDGVRRVGAILNESLFGKVAAEVARHY